MTRLPREPLLVELVPGGDAGQGSLLCHVIREEIEPDEGTKTVTLHALSHRVPQQSSWPSGTTAALIYRRDGVLWRQACLLLDGSGFPKLKAAVQGQPSRLQRESLAEVEATFPVRFQVIGAREAAEIGRRFRERMQMQMGWSPKAGRELGPAGALLDNHAELAILSLAKSMVRLDARFDRLLGKLSQGRRKAVVSGEEQLSSSPQEVLIFSLAKMMVTLLDEKFERLLAALRDPNVLARWSKKSAEEVGEEASRVSHEVMVIQSLARFMEGMGEKFERIVRLLSGRRLVSVALEDAWAVTVGGDMLTLRLARPLPLDSVLDLELKLPIFPPVPLLAFGRIVSCSARGDDVPEERFEARVEMVGLDAEDRELLIQFVFRKQREMLRARRELQS